MIKYINFFLVLFILAFGIIHSPSLAEKVTYKEEASFSGEILNFHILTPDIMRGGQPSEEGFRMLRNVYGIKTILSLRNNLEYIQWEKTIAEKMGMDFINISMDGKMRQDIETIERCLEIINDESRQPIFVHCRSGKNRTGMIFAAHRMKYNGWSFQEALMEMFAYGYNRQVYPELEKSLIKWDAWQKEEFP